MAKRLKFLGLPIVRLLVGGIILTFALTVLAGIISVSYEPNRSTCKCDEPKDVKEPDPHRDVVPIQDGKHKLCVLVPFRDRFEELLEFAPHLHKFLNKQGTEHILVIVNQLDKFRFNRASLINVGFLETRSRCDYIAMHDVDLLPQNEELRYDFPEKGPYHLASPHLHPLYHYKTYVGGILLLQSKHFELLNGLSNKYWGWGKEDDEFFVRMRKARLNLSRPGNLTTGYKSFRHIHDRRKRPRDNQKFFDQWEKTRRLDRETGVATVKYALDSENKLIIDGAPVTIFNVYLECDLAFTPWCLKAEDHKNYDLPSTKKKEEVQSKAQPTAKPSG